MKTFSHNELIELINSLVSHPEIVELNCLAGLIKLFKLSELIVKYPIGLIVRIISLTGHNGIVGFIGLVGHNGIVGILGLDGIISLINCNIGLIDCNDLVDHNGLVSCNDLADHIGLEFIGYNGLVSFIGLGIIGFVGLSLVSLGGLIDHFSLVGLCIIGLIESAASSNHWPIGLIGVISLGLIVLSASMASLAHWLISFVSIIGSSTYWLFCERLTAAVIEATKITWQLKQAAALGVATLQSSATKTAASTYYVTASSFHVHSLVREKMWWWLALARKKMWRWIASFGQNNYFLSGFRK